MISTDEGRQPVFYNLASAPAAVAWTSDSEAFDYVENTDAGAGIWRQNLDEKAAPQLILDLPKEYIFNFAWSAKGKFLALARGQELNDAMLLTDFQP